MSHRIPISKIEDNIDEVVDKLNQLYPNKPVESTRRINSLQTRLNFLNRQLSITKSPYGREMFGKEQKVVQAQLTKLVQRHRPSKKTNKDVLMKAMRALLTEVIVEKEAVSLIFKDVVCHLSCSEPWCNSSYLHGYYKLGSCKVSIHPTPDGSGIYIKGAGRGWRHPHVGGSGTVCWGQMKNPPLACLRRRNFVGALMGLRAFLGSGSCRGGFLTWMDPKKKLVTCPKV